VGQCEYGARVAAVGTRGVLTDGVGGWRRGVQVDGVDTEFCEQRTALRVVESGEQ
jgi:hypothetical protein